MSSELLDAIFPENFCNICKTPMNTNEIICGVCKDEYMIDYENENYCKICGKPVFHSGDYCNICKEYKRTIVNRSLVVYDGEVKNTIYEFKYGGHKYIGRRYAEKMCEEFHDYIKDSDLMIPVPIHFLRYLKRGFNQTEILCKYINKIEQIPFECGIIKRNKYTKYLSNYKEAERRKILKDAFLIKKEDLVKGKRILIVDDIFTTGATVDTIGNLLLKSGAKSVKSLTITTTAQSD